MIVIGALVGLVELLVAGWLADSLFYFFFDFTNISIYIHIFRIAL